MKRPFRLILLVCVFALAWNPYGSGPILLLGGPQITAPRLPDGPPPGTPMPGDLTEVHPKAPEMPPDFLEGPKQHKAGRKTVDSAQAQKDAEALAALSKKVQGEVNQLSKNILSKDLDQDLKQIQKLTKRLRGEIAP